MSAVATTITTMISLPTCSAPRLGVLYDDALQDVGHVLRGVDRLLEALEDVLPADHDHGIDPRVEQRRDRLADDPVTVVLEPVQLDGVVRDVAEPAQPRHRLGDLARGRVEHPREVLRLLYRRLDLVEP